MNTTTGSVPQDPKFTIMLDSCMKLTTSVNEVLDAINCNLDRIMQRPASPSNQNCAKDSCAISDAYGAICLIQERLLKHEGYLAETRNRISDLF